MMGNQTHGLFKSCRSLLRPIADLAYRALVLVGPASVEVWFPTGAATRLLNRQTLASRENAR